MDKKTLIEIYTKEVEDLEKALKEKGDGYTYLGKHLINILIADRKQFLYYIDKLP